MGVDSGKGACFGVLSYAYLLRSPKAQSSAGSLAGSSALCTLAQTTNCFVRLPAQMPLDQGVSKLWPQDFIQSTATFFKSQHLLM